MADEQALTPADVGPFPLKQVFAVGAAANVATVGSMITKSGAKRIEEAMSNAVRYCYEKGIIDPEVVKAYMMQARENVKRDMAQEAVTPQGNPEG